MCERLFLGVAVCAKKMDCTLQVRKKEDREGERGVREELLILRRLRYGVLVYSKMGIDLGQ